MMFVSSGNHMLFAGQFFGGEISLKNTKLNIAFVFELPIHWMSASGNVEEQRLHPRQHLRRKQLLATHDECRLIWEPW